MKFLLALLPPWVAPALAGLLLVGLVAGYFGWQHHQRAIGAAAVELADTKAVAAQHEKDAQLSKQLAADLEKRLATREATAAPVREVVRNVSSACSTQTGPDLDAAAGWVRGALAPKAGGSPAKR